LLPGGPVHKRLFSGLGDAVLSGGGGSGVRGGPSFRLSNSSGGGGRSAGGGGNSRSARLGCRIREGLPPRKDDVLGVAWNVRKLPHTSTPWLLTAVRGRCNFPAVGDVGAC